jgi:intracellular septation protein A
VAEEKKPSGAVLGIMSFLPWVLFGFASGTNHWQLATGGGLILCLIYLAALRRWNISIKLMDWTTLAVFVIGSVFVLGLHSAVFPTYSVVVIWLCFAMAAWSSVAIGRPFTVAYARDTAPPEFWEHPIFLRLNMIMTLFWCGLLTLNLAFGVTGVIVGGTLGQLVLGFALPMTALIGGFIFNSRFPARYLARAGFPVDGSGATPVTAT